jgi:hypothetical protein
VLIIAGAIDDGVRIRIPMLQRPGVEIQWARLEAATDAELLQIIERSLDQSYEGAMQLFREAVRAARPSKSKILAARTRRATTLH